MNLAKSYIPQYDGKLHSISSNIDDYKQSVEDRDEAKNLSKSLDPKLNYYKDKAAKAQADLDREMSIKNSYDNNAKDAEKRRAEILAQAKNRKNSTVKESEDNPIENSDLYNKIKEIADKYDDRATITYSSFNNSISVIIRVGPNFNDPEVYGDISLDGTAKLMTSSGPNVLDIRFINLLQDLYNAIGNK